jgi:tetrahydromethanopterin S-methyltransferase subunit F
VTVSICANTSESFDPVGFVARSARVYSGLAAQSILQIAGLVVTMAVDRA